ncbi:DUF6647 family protein [Fodinicurvata sediminis]|uniref:DUF6647 family protein n=1 Tax=Fodinicurvata sediminis TaxID=1121832 RepID=UPI001B7F809A|nr:DUF6647 family protein [Fodinicurvata sediminis]
MRAVMKSIVFALFVASIGQVSANEPQAPPSLLDTITLWLAANFELPSSPEPPALVTVPASVLVEIRYGSAGSVSPGDVMALYDDTSRTIYLTEGWTGSTPAQLSILVHEMVHHLQSSSDMRFACPGERELLAYRAQGAWLELFGLNLETAFGIDPATLLVATVCTH